MPADRDDPPGHADGDDRSAPPDPRTAPPPGSVRREAAAFRWAAHGIGAALRTEPHLRFHAAATVAVVVLAVVLPLTGTDRALLALAIGVVWTAELVNTALESLVDLVHPGLDPVAGRVKDVAAGAVLVAAVASAVCGVLVLGPPLVALLVDLIGAR